MQASRRRLAALAAVLGLSASLPAAAAGLACGEYRDADARFGRVLVVRDAQQALLRRPDQATQRYLYRVDGGRLTLYDLDDGYRNDYGIEDEGRRLLADEATFGDYRLHEARACESPTLPPPGECRADLDRCLDGAREASASRLHAWCDEGLPFACVRLIDAWREADAATQSPAAGMPPKPAVCEQDTPAYDETACREAALAALAQMRTSSLPLFGGEDRPLAAPRLERLPALCGRSGSATVCGKVAEELWTAGRFVAARTALDTACSRGEDPDACEALAPLAELDAGTLAAVPVDALPCGRYTAQTGLMSELEFGDRGRVLGSFGASLRARLEDGRVRMRHDKGGDFVFARLGDGSLLGLDDWNRYALYRRQGEAGQCATPVVYDERPLQQDCAALDRAGAQACCARGSLHGCNVLGNRLALADDWTGAAERFAQVCRQKVRVGCENLLQAYGHGADIDARALLQTICDGSPRHVACDVLETAGWEALEVGRAIGEAAKALEAGSPDVTDDGP